MKQGRDKFDVKIFKGKCYWLVTQTMKSSPWGLVDSLILSEITQNISMVLLGQRFSLLTSLT